MYIAVTNNKETTSITKVSSVFSQVHTDWTEVLHLIMKMLLAFKILDSQHTDVY